MSHGLPAPFASISGQTPVAEAFATFLRMLQDLQATYGDDYEAIAIVALVHEVTFSDCRENPIARRSTQCAPPDAQASVSRLKVAETLGIPRETVRRKVNELIARGVIEEVDRAQLVTARQHKQVAKELSASMARHILTAKPGKKDRC